MAFNGGTNEPITLSDDEDVALGPPTKITRHRVSKPVETLADRIKKHESIPLDLSDDSLDVSSTENTLSTYEVMLKESARRREEEMKRRKEEAEDELQRIAPTITHTKSILELNDSSSSDTAELNSNPSSPGIIRGPIGPALRRQSSQDEVEAKMDLCYLVVLGEDFKVIFSQPYSRTSPLSELAHELAKTLKREASEIHFTLKDDFGKLPLKSSLRDLDPEKEDWELRVTLAVGVDDSDDEANDKEEEVDPNIMLLNFVAASTKKVIPVDKTKTFNELSEQIAKRLGLTKPIAYFLFDYEKVDLSRTPVELDMEEDDCIEVYV